VKSSRENLREVWRQRVAESRNCAEGVAEYCKQSGIKRSTLGYWDAQFRSKSIGRPRKISDFVPVSVVNETTDLPDPKWLAQFAAELIRGIR